MCEFPSGTALLFLSVALLILTGCSGAEQPVAAEGADPSAVETAPADAHGEPASAAGAAGGEPSAGEPQAAHDLAEAHRDEGHAAEGEAEGHGAATAEPFVEATYMVPPGELRRFLVIVSGACDAGLVAEQLRQADDAAGGMRSGEVRQLAFPVNFRGAASEFEMTLFMDDPSVLEVILFGPPALVDALGDLADEAILALNLRELQ